MKKRNSKTQGKFHSAQKTSKRKPGLGNASSTIDIQSVRRMFLEHGYDPIPLRPQSKLPISKRWQTRPTVRQWENVGENVNIGLRANFDKSFLDADDKNIPGTSGNIIRYMAGLGYQEGDYPLVQTPSNSYQLYVRFNGVLPGSTLNLKPEIGAGEFRFGQGAYVGTFPSRTDAGEYRLISGDIGRLPTLDLKDISALVEAQRRIASVSPPKKRMSRLAFDLANGKGAENYRSRSEGEFALVLSLINSKYNYEEIKYIFDNYPTLGHYREKHKSLGEGEAHRWLFMTYQRALPISEQESPVRRIIARFLQQAEILPWSNSNNRQVLIAHLKIAHKAGRLEYAASVRDLALNAGIGIEAVSKHTHKLLNEGLLTLEKEGYGRLAHVYVLNVDKIEHSLGAADEWECSDMSCFEVEKHDAFRNGPHRLGRRAGEIYALLLKKQLTVKEISDWSGAHPKTVERALKKMRSKVIDRLTGEIIEMVSEEDGKWHANPVNLNDVAKIMGTYGARGRQQRRYAKERRDHARELELEDLKKESEDKGES